MKFEGGVEEEASYLLRLVFALGNKDVLFLTADSSVYFLVFWLSVISGYKGNFMTGPWFLNFLSKCPLSSLVVLIGC